MILTIGLLALLHACFLPGWLLLRGFGLAGRGAETVLLAVVLSLALNPLIAALLLALGLFRQGPILGVIAFELALLAMCLFRRGPARQAPVAPADAAHATAGMLLAAAMLALFAPYFVTAASSVFSLNDDVLSWNRWALDWTGGAPPDMSMNYPQLVPLNWATVYIAAGAPIQFLSKAIMPAFPLATVLMMVVLGVRVRSAGALLAAPILAGLVYAVYPEYIASGFVDLPVMTFGFATYFALRLADLESALEAVLARLATALLLCAAAAHTKQAGLFMLIPFIPLAWYVLGRRGFSQRERAFAAGAMIFALAVLIVPWYLYKHLQIAAGIERNITPVVTGGFFFHEGRGPWARVAHAVVLLAEHVPPSALALLGAGALGGLAAGTWAAAAALIGISFALVWMLGFSYDVRNVSLALPFLALAAGSAAAALVRKGTPYVPLSARAASRARSALSCLAHAGARARRIAPAAVLGAALTTYAWLAWNWSDARLLAAHDAQLRRIGDPRIDAALYAAHAAQPFAGPIVTNYRYLEFLPELNRYYDPWYKKRYEIARRPMRNLTAFRDYLREYPSIRYVLIAYSRVAPGVPRGIVDAVSEGIRQGTYRVVGAGDGFTLVDLAPSGAPPAPSAPAPSAASERSAR
jgi:hypothetical protein